jgi:hypothetical protein
MGKFNSSFTVNEYLEFDAKVSQNCGLIKRREIEIKKNPAMVKK